MDLNRLNGIIRSNIKGHSSIILSVGAGIGTITTAYLAHKAGVNKVALLKEDKKRRQKEGELPYIGRQYHFNLLWKNYVPVTISATGTIVCIIFANRIDTKKVVAAQFAATAAQRAFEEYTEKVVEQIGPRKNESIRNKIAEDKVEANPPPSKDILVTGPGNVLCCELYTGRYFVSDMETLRRATNELNSNLLKHDYATLNDFYYIIHLSQTSHSGEIGWKSDKLLELEFTAVITDDERPCMAFDYNYVCAL